MNIFLRQLWAFVRPHRGRLFGGIAAGLVYAAGSGLLLLAVKLVFDAIFPTEAARGMADSLAKIPVFLREPIQQALERLRVDKDSPVLIWLIASVPFAMILRGMGAYLSLYSMTRVATETVHDLRVRIFEHLQKLSLDYFGSARTGDLQSRLMNDTQAIQQCIAVGFSTIAKEPASVIGIVTFLTLMQPRLTVVALVVFPLVVVPVVIFGRKVRKSWKAAQIHTAELTDHMQENFTAIRVVKAFNLESTMAAKFAATSRRITSQYMRFVRGSELPGPMIETFGAIGVSMLLYYVMRMPGGAKPSAGDFTSFVGALFSLYQPVKNLSRLWAQLEQGRAAGERLFPVLETSPGIPEPASPKPLVAAGADIRFDKIDFSYGEKAVLHGFSLDIPAGSMLALVGGTGSGKTTVTNLLLRFYDPQRGSVKIGGVDIRDTASSTLRDQMAVVSQETLLFNDTIRANIRMGRPSATDAEVEEAARHAHAHEFIMARPQGYETPVGERGTLLSGGQKQRIAIARALLRNAPILILDEATSSLDTKVERDVQAALETLMAGRTTICIAHRLSTIQKADCIVAMEDGRIVEKGTHAELLAMRGVYARLHALQFSTEPVSA